MGRAARVGPITAVGAHPSARRMVMSDSATLAPRGDSDSAVGQGAVRDAAGEKAVDRYRTWVGDHRYHHWFFIFISYVYRSRLNPMDPN